MKPYIQMTLAIYATALVYGVLIGVFAFVLSDIRHASESMEKYEAVSGQPVQKERLSSWDILTLAIIKTESEFDSTAVNGDNYGILQIRPIYVEECNRTLGIERYTHEDAFSVSKSLEMFSVIQEHYNPQHDVQRAIELHNPSAGLWYSEKVMRNFRALVKQSEIINQLCR